MARTLDDLDFHRDGAAVLRRVIDCRTLDALRAETESSHHRAGRRSFAPSATISALIGHDGALGQLAARFAGVRMHPVRLILFDKTAETNWSVAWHQDRTIAVRERIDVPGFGPWSVKDGVRHVEPPAELLADMVTVRLHLDDCGPANGALAICPGSHRLGRVPVGEIAGVARRSASVLCAVEAGDVLVMRLLTVHASATARTPSRRRVLHVDYAVGALPGGLEWAFSVNSASTQGAY